MGLRIERRSVGLGIERRDLPEQTILRHFLHGRARDDALEIRHARRIFRQRKDRLEQTREHVSGRHAAQQCGQAERGGHARRRPGVAQFYAAFFPHQPDEGKRVQRRAAHRSCRAVNQHSGKRMAFSIQQRQRGAQQKRRNDIHLSRAANRQKPLRQNQAQRQQHFGANAPVSPVRRVRRQNRQPQIADHAQQLDRIHVINRAARHRIKQRQRRGGEIQRRFIRGGQPHRIHFPHKRQNLFRKEQRFLIDGERQQQKAERRQHLSQRQTPKSLPVQKRLHRQHRRMRRRRQRDERHAVRPAADIVEVAQRPPAHVQSSRQRRQNRRQQQPQGARMAVCKIHDSFHAVSPPFARVLRF